jgi:hypothetical protein
MHRPLIDAYAEGAHALHRAIAGLSRTDLNATPPAGSPGTWTLQQIVLHLWDSDLIGVHRMRRVIAEERPLLIGYEESLFVKALHYEHADATLAADAYKANRLLLADTLRRLPDEAFSRWGVHNESGKKTLADLVKGYVEHTDYHMKFVAEKRRLMGRPMA